MCKTRKRAVGEGFRAISDPSGVPVKLHSVADASAPYCSTQTCQAQPLLRPPCSSVSPPSCSCSCCSSPLSSP
eukprot:3370469-Amphidinium_carterae.1